MKTLIVSPTYNESKNIADLIEHIFTLDKNYHLLIVDDNSPDGTAELVEKFQKRYSNLHLKKRPGKAGLGTAYKFGFKWALENDYDAIVQMDADGSHDANDVPDLVAGLEDIDNYCNKGYDSLPMSMQRYIEFIENEVNCPITIISLGPERTQTIIRSDI